MSERELYTKLQGNKKVLLPSSRTLIAAEPRTQGAEAVFLYARLTVHIWQCRCVVLRHRTAGGNSTDPAWARTRAFAAGTCLPLPLLPEGCGRRHPPRLFSCWKCSLRGWPTGLGALAQLLGPNQAHGAALFPPAPVFVPSWQIVQSRADTMQGEKWKPITNIVHKQLRNSAPTWESRANCPWISVLSLG